MLMMFITKKRMDNYFKTSSIKFKKRGGFRPLVLLVPPIARFASLLGVDQSILLLAPHLVLLDGVDPILREVGGGDGADAPERRALGNALGLELRVLGGEIGIEGDLVGGEGGVHHADKYG